MVFSFVFSAVDKADYFDMAVDSGTAADYGTTDDSDTAVDSGMTADSDTAVDSGTADDSDMAADFDTVVDSDTAVDSDMTADSGMTADFDVVVDFAEDVMVFGNSVCTVLLFQVEYTLFLYSDYLCCLNFFCPTYYAPFRKACSLFIQQTAGSYLFQFLDIHCNAGDCCTD